MTPAVKTGEQASKPMEHAHKPMEHAHKPMEHAHKPMDLDAMAADALRRITSHINRAAGQHLRAMRRTSQPTTPPQEPTA